MFVYGNVRVVIKESLLQCCESYERAYKPPVGIIYKDYSLWHFTNGTLESFFTPRTPLLSFPWFASSFAFLTCTLAIIIGNGDELDDFEGETTTYWCDSITALCEMCILHRVDSVGDSKGNSRRWMFPFSFPSKCFLFQWETYDLFP